MDIVTLLTEENIYAAMFILCQVNDSFKNVLYYSHFAISIIEIITLSIVFYMILRILRRHLVTTHNLFKWNFKICMALCFIAIILHGVYVYPTSGDRYGMLEITQKGEKNIYEAVKTVAGIFTITF